MKLSSLALALFSASAALAGPVPAGPAAPAPVHLCLKFEKVPLGNVARILSARFKVTVAISSKALAPISGDFSKMDLRQALTEAGRQTGLVVRPLGSGAADGFSLAPPDPPPAAVTGPEAKAPDPGAGNPGDVKARLEEAARQRQELLKRQEGLLEQSALADPES
jgi:hypothetical protein